MTTAATESIEQVVINDGVLDVFDRWLSVRAIDIGQHRLIICAENDTSQDEILPALQEIVRSHFVAPEVTAKRLAELGAPATAELLSEHLPESETARSGDLGEILATEITERQLDYRVPIRRLRWKDGRNMALRGDDIIAIAHNSAGRLKLLKGESKSRAELTTAVVTQAADALNRDNGRPTRHSVLFVSERLREGSEDELARELEEAVLNSFASASIEHLLFMLSGNNPVSFLSNYANRYLGPPVLYAIGVRITNHGAFVERVFSEL